MKRTSALILTVVLAAAVSFGADEKAPTTRPADQARHVDLAICLDTSGSMTGLIDSAKQKLWAVVNELATAEPKPLLRVALYHYGNSGLDRETGWVKQLCPLTDDLDTIYGKLFALTTNGGTEYVARVVRTATEELKWNTDKGTLRIIFVAGNEPATQDNEFKLQDVCSATVGKGIIINTIFCGSEAEGSRTGWADAARWADGRYAAIDQDSGTVVIATPHDKKLAELSAELNKTYVSYGVRGGKGSANQSAQDANAAKLNPSAAAERAVSKSSSLYSNAAWDLVDAAGKKDFDITKVKEDDLPENMRKMTVAEREAYIAEQANRRAEIQKQIKDLGTERDAYVKKEMERKGLSEKSAFDAVLRTAVREQAVAKGFQFEKKAE